MVLSAAPIPPGGGGANPGPGRPPTTARGASPPLVWPLSPAVMPEGRFSSRVPMEDQRRRCPLSWRDMSVLTSLYPGPVPGPYAIAQVTPYPWEDAHEVNAYVRALSERLAGRGH